METSSATSFNPATNSVPRTEIELIPPGTLLYPCLSWTCAPALSLSCSSSALWGTKIFPYFFFICKYRLFRLTLKIVEGEMQCNGLGAETGSLVSPGFYVGYLVTKFSFYTYWDSVTHEIVFWRCLLPLVSNLHTHSVNKIVLMDSIF